ncbi:MAG: dTDP-4-dehydrorhamnose reductase [Paracoccaceae bacterium]|jgi:dTDP-4-dehydrorhamnose reductase
MKIVVFGKSGQVATELQRQGDVVALGRGDADFARPADVAAAAEGLAADVFINAAAYTAVDKAETEEAEATAINGTSVAILAKVAARRGIPLLHVSTDYVFAGGGTAPWQPDDATGPLGAYGRSKRVGEQGVVAAGGAFAILRTSWVFSAHGANFVKTMLRLGAQRDALTVVGDQIGGPTPAADIAAALLRMADRFVAGKVNSGIYHYSGAPDASWADFAREIFAQADLKCAVTDIPTAAYPTPAQRPANSRMDCSTLERDFGLLRPDWRAGLAQVLTELKAV